MSRTQALESRTPYNLGVGRVVNVIHKRQAFSSSRPGRSQVAKLPQCLPEWSVDSKRKRVRVLSGDVT